MDDFINVVKKDPEVQIKQKIFQINIIDYLIIINQK